MTLNGPSSDAHRAVEHAARTSYGRLVAMLAARTRDMAIAEDALADAFRVALETWTAKGVPDRPEAWILTTARHRLHHRWRHERVEAAAASTLELIAEETAGMAAGRDFPDERLKLLVVCAHPAIDPAMQAPLMLQMVLGLDAAQISAAFLVSPAAMSQRLVRAKAKIRDAGIPFELPDDALMPQRLTAVLTAIYAAYGSGWDDVRGADLNRKDLTEEAIWLARALVSLCPSHPEAKGLLAFMLHCQARRAARRTADGRYVPLDQQDTGLWSPAMITEAERLLAEAATCGEIGRFQLEAAIQSAHVERLLTGRDTRTALIELYGLLRAVAPTIGVEVAYAAALAASGDTQRALGQLDGLLDAARGYQPYWAARGHLLQRLGRSDEARRAFETAAGLTEDPAVRAFLLAAEPGE